MSKKRLFEIITLILLFEPTLFVKYDILNYIFAVGAVMCLIYYIIVYIKENIKIPTYIIILMVYRILLLYMTATNKGDILKACYQTVFILAILLVTNIKMKTSPNIFIKDCKNIFIVYLLINIIMYYLIQNKILNLEISFLGIRTRFTDYAYPAILLIFLDYILNESNNKSYLVIQFIIIILNILIPKISTAIIGLIIFFFCMFIFNKKMLNNFIGMRKIFIGTICINLLVIYGKIQKYFSFFIEKVLNKDISLTGRTRIWKESWKYIKDSIIIGHGMPKNGNFIELWNTTWQAHNQFLQFLYEGGIINCLLIFIVLFYIFKCVDNLENKKVQKIIKSFYTGLLIMLITEIYFYYPPIYLIIAITYGLKNIKN